MVRDFRWSPGLSASGRSTAGCGARRLRRNAAVCRSGRSSGSNPAQGRGQAPAQASSAAPPPAPVVTTAEIPGVIAAGLKWTKIWEALGNNADGIVADKDGNLLIAQEEASAAIKSIRMTKLPS